MPPLQPIYGKIEHLEDFTAHEWCNALLSDPSVTHISKRQNPDQVQGIPNTFFTHTLFTDDALRAFLSLYKPGKGFKRRPGEEFFMGIAPLYENPASPNASAEAQRQNLKEEKTWDANDLETPEAICLASIGQELDGSIRKIHGGVIATLLDQAMGTVILYTYEHRCVTSDLNIKYKQPIETPCILLCRGKVVREKGRWIETRGWIEDGKGKILAEASGVFVMNKVGNAKI
ncbi:HotDog domain-containing protein [Phaeosphaeriaceae sp. PMI808]|nr:HotDog domain-containing protein [Phaeosphaeriaceae sp. PMI808]